MKLTYRALTAASMLASVGLSLVAFLDGDTSECLAWAVCTLQLATLMEGKR
jgi:hypothetical protein